MPMSKYIVCEGHNQKLRLKIVNRYARDGDLKRIIYFCYLQICFILVILSIQ